DELYIGLHLFAREVSRGLQKAVPCERVGTAVIGLEVPHAHVHLVPINQISDMDMGNPRKQFSPEEMEQIAADIRAQLP
ncbi:MAG: HIT family protein, partial [Bacteroidota bacterium]